MSSALTTCGKHNSTNCPMTDKDNVNNIFCDLDRDDNSIDALMNVKGGDSDDSNYFGWKMVKRNYYRFIVCVV